MSDFYKFKAVLFDLGGTIIKTLEVPEIYRKILEVYGVKVPKMLGYMLCFLTVKEENFQTLKQSQV